MNPEPQSTSCQIPTKETLPPKLAFWCCAVLAIGSLFALGSHPVLALVVAVVGGLPCFRFARDYPDGRRLTTKLFAVNHALVSRIPGQHAHKIGIGAAVLGIAGGGIVSESAWAGMLILLASVVLAGAALQAVNRRSDADRLKIGRARMWAVGSLVVAVLCLLGGAFEAGDSGNAGDPEQFGYDMTEVFFLPIADRSMAPARVVFFANEQRRNNATVKAYNEDEFRRFRNGALRAFVSWQTGVPIPPPKKGAANSAQTIGEEAPPIQPPLPPGSASPSTRPSRGESDDFSRQHRPL